MLKAGVVRPSISPWSFPVTMVKKKDNSLRFCVDYRKLNSVTVTEHTPLPYIEDLLNRVANSCYFSALDLAWGYWQIALDQESMEKTSFVTVDGQYEFLVLPFGLKNAPSTFQRILRDVLRPFIGKGVENYLDDIIVHTKTKEEHKKLIHDVMHTLEKTNIRLRKEKCSFFSTEIEILGHVVSHGIIKPSPRKVGAVREFPTPSSRKQLQQFAGLANYYRNFVGNYSRIAAPLYRLTKKDTEFVWSDECEDAFQTLKTKITSEPVLAAFDPNRECILQTDASGIGVGAILSQKDEQGIEHVISYYSKKLSETQSRYSAVELECFAVVLAIQHFRVYLEGKKFEIITDCSALSWLEKFKTTKRRLFGWSFELSAYDYALKHRSGAKNQAADALSRNPVNL